MKLQLNELVSRVVRDSPDVEALRESIRKVGLLKPIRVKRLSTGRYLVTEGAMRLRALILNGETEVEAKLIETNNN